MLTLLPFDMLPEELRECEIINMNEKSDEKNEDVPGEVTLKRPIEVHIERILRDNSLH